jgi:F420-0:gamma-glutamyl ligase
MNPSLPTDKDAVPVSINKSVGVIIANWNGRQCLDITLCVQGIEPLRLI